MSLWLALHNIPVVAQIWRNQTSHPFGHNYSLVLNRLFMVTGTQSIIIYGNKNRDGKVIGYLKKANVQGNAPACSYLYR
jgi:hypothetical protein